jgi:hypothetical protein
MIDVPVCEQCGEQHIVNRRGKPLASCIRHATGGKTRPERRGKACHGIPMRGQKVCKSHGGKSAQALAAAEQRTQQAEAAKILHAFGERVDVDPAEELLDLICHTAGYVRFIRTRVNQLTVDAMTWGITKETDGGVVVGTGPKAELVADTTTTRETKPNVWIQMLDHWTDKLARLIVEALKLNLDERRVRLAERQGDAMMRILDGVLAELGHDPAEPETAKIVARHLRRVGE